MKQELTMRFDAAATVAASSPRARAAEETIRRAWPEVPDLELMDMPRPPTPHQFRMMWLHRTIASLPSASHGMEMCHGYIDRSAFVSRSHRIFYIIVCFCRRAGARIQVRHQADGCEGGR